jgi:hypothetical protein
MSDHYFAEKIRAAFAPLGCEIKWVVDVNRFDSDSAAKILAQAQRRKEDAVSEKLKQRFVALNRAAKEAVLTKTRSHAVQQSHQLIMAMCNQPLNEFSGLLAQALETCLFYHDLADAEGRKIILPLMTLMMKEFIFPFLCVSGRLYCITFKYTVS